MESVASGLDVRGVTYESYWCSLCQIRVEVRDFYVAQAIFDIERAWQASVEPHPVEI